MFLPAEYATLALHCWKPVEREPVPALHTANKNSILACRYLRQRRGVWGGEGGAVLAWGMWVGCSSFGRSFSPLALLAGVSVQVLLITSHWSGNPADLTGSNRPQCPLQPTTPPPPTSPSAFPPSAPSPCKALKCMTAKGALWRRDAQRIGGMGVRALEVCPYKPSGQKVC